MSENKQQTVIYSFEVTAVAIFEHIKGGNTSKVKEIRFALDPSPNLRASDYITPEAMLTEAGVEAAITTLIPTLSAILKSAKNLNMDTDKILHHLNLKVKEGFESSGELVTGHFNDPVS